MSRNQWPTQRLGSCYSVRDERAGSLADELPLMSVSQIHGVVPRAELVGDSGRAEDLSKYKVAMTGDIVLNRMSAYNGALGVARQNGIVSPDYLVMIPSVLADPDFVAAGLKTPLGVSEMSRRLRGIGSADSSQVRTPRVNESDLRLIPVALPPLDEQRAIADYLDRETARIDTLIEEIETSIALSGERRSALITAAVTGQIDVTSSAAGEMGRQDYDSGGVNFSLGERRRSRLRYCLKVDPPVDPSVRENPYLEVSFLPMEAIGEHGGLDLTREIPAQEASSGYTSVADGDVVLAKVTPCFENGKGALVFGLKNGFGFATTEVYALRPNHGTNARFLDYVLRSSEFRQYGTARLTGAGGLKRLSSTDLKNFEITLPSPDEQRAIADYLDRETARIDTLIAEQRKLVELARERRSALITAAVTGQIDVRKAS